MAAVQHIIPSEILANRQNWPRDSLAASLSFESVGDMPSGQPSDPGLQSRRPGGDRVRDQTDSRLAEQGHSGANTGSVGV